MTSTATPIIIDDDDSFASSPSSSASAFSSSSSSSSSSSPAPAVKLLDLPALRNSLINFGYPKQNLPKLRVDDNGSLLLSGTIPQQLGSLLNMAVWNFVKTDGPRFGLSWDRIVFKALKYSGAKRQASAADDDDEEDEELKESFDAADDLERKAQFVADHILAKRGPFVLYTGAGISTAAQIPDFRGPNGVWTRRDQGLKAPDCIEMEQAVPTYAHRCVKRLLEDNTASYLISQNVDGLHRRSGVPADKISELHGNCYIEVCANSACKAEFQRCFDVADKRGPHFRKVKDKLSKSGISHITGRKCEKCGEGMLRDNIIHFTEDLPERALELGWHHSEQAKFGLVLGSSLRVTPAADLPIHLTQSGGTLCVVNLQTTGGDEAALQSGGVLIHCKIDEFVERVMERLGKGYPNTERNRKAAEREFAAQVEKELEAAGMLE